METIKDKKVFNLSNNQQGIYFDCQVEEVPYYNLSAAISIEADLDISLFEEAMKILINRHSIFRICFELEDDMPNQVIFSEIEYKLDVEDISNLDSEEQDKIIKRVSSDNVLKKFDLSKVPLFRTKLLKTGKEEFLFFFCVHHIVADGWSLALFRKELLETYIKLTKGEEGNREPGDKEFIGFVIEENEKLNSGKYESKKDYWSQKIQGARPLNLITDHPITAENKKLAKEVEFLIQGQLFKDLKQVSIKKRTTLFMFLFATFKVFLHKYTGERDITVASPFTNRPGLDYEDAMGYFSNNLPIRDIIESEMTFESFLKEVKKSIIGAYKNVQYPNNLIFRELASKDGLNNSLMNITFVFDVYEEENMKIDGDIKVSELPQDFISIPSVLMMDFFQNFDNDKEMIGKIQYDSGLFDESTIRRMCEHFNRLLKQIIASPEAKISDFNLIAEEDKTIILEKFNDSFVPVDYNRTINEVFEEKALTFPDQIGMVCKDNELTYSEVNQKANQLARFLRYKGIKVGSTVGLMVNRSLEMAIGVLGILKAGGTYVAINPDYSDSRINYILNDSNTSILFTNNMETGFTWDGELIDINLDNKNIYQGNGENLDRLNTSRDLAYILYTSGSTGKPKGVMIEHRSVINTLSALEGLYPLTENDSYLLKTPFTFDVSVTELFGWFFGSGKLVILENDHEKDPTKIVEAIEKYNITHINFVPSMFRMFLDLFIDNYDIAKLNSLKYIFVAGEAIKPKVVRDFYNLDTDIEFVNIYGPTEATIYASYYPLKNFETGVNVPIGQPIPNCKTYIVDENDNLQPVGIPGELCLSGIGLARGYINRDELTAEKFVPNPFGGNEEENTQKMYRTGDLARWLPDGNIEYLGRIDFQVKIRGNRVELGEIENTLLDHEKINEVVVTAIEDKNEVKILCAYYTGDESNTTTELREYLAEKLPLYMVPSQFIQLNEMPLGSSGKIERSKLPSPKEFSRRATSSYIAPQTEIEQAIAGIWKEVLGVEKVGVNDNFFDLGGHSLSLIKVSNKIRSTFGIDISVIKLFQYPTIQSLVQFIEGSEDNDSSVQTVYTRNNKKEEVDTEIAIIGIAGRFPGATNVNEFWENLKNGVNSIKRFSKEELRESGVPEEELKNPNYINSKGIIDDVEYFDPELFKYSPREVEVMDPQLRVIYKCAYEALEQAGYADDRNNGLVGCFLGCSDNFNWTTKFLFDQSNQGDQYQTYTLNASHFLSTRVSYKLNLKGPSFTAHTGCSTSLVTIHLACQSLIRQECDMAIAGGVTVELPNKQGYVYEPGMMFSADGNCRPFDRKANGTVFSDGAGAILLKPLKKAIEDGDHIHAVIKGSVINNDGNDKVAYTAPSIKGQVGAITSAYQRTGIDPETIGYFEAHGTATNMGDPIETQALQLALNLNKKQSCYLGSVKGNIGHTDIASGVVGLIKTVLCLKNKQIPPTVNFENPNPKIDFIDSPFVVNQKLIDWERNNHPLRAGISSFGVGGTNAHIILEEAPEYEKSSSDVDWKIFCLSAETRSALNRGVKDLATFLSNNKEINLSDVAYTLQVGRKHFKHRKMVVCNTVDEAISKLEFPEKLDLFFVKNEGIKNSSFILRGEENYSLDKVRELYKNESYLKEIVDDCFDLLETNLREDVEKAYQDEDLKFEDINRVEVKRSVIFITGYALAKLLIKWGIKPASIIGMGLGENIGACVAGAIFIKDALSLISTTDVEALREKLNKIEIKIPSINCISAEDMQLINRDKINNYKYWVSSQDENSVDLTERLEELILKGDNHFIELGVNDSSIASLFADQKESGYLNLLPGNNEESSYKHLYNIVSELWCRGINVNWDALYQEKRYRVPLPTYSFDQHYFSVGVINPHDLFGGNANFDQVATTNEPKVLYQREKSEDYIGPRNDIEKVVVGAFEKVLGMTNISVDEDFFELGGDSLKAVSLSSELQKQLNVKIDLSELFSRPTPAEISEYASESADTSIYSAIEPVEEREYYPLSSAQKRMYALYQFDEQSVAYNLPSVTIIEGDVDFERFEKAFTNLTDRYEALRTSFDIVNGEPVQIVHKDVKLDIKYKEVAIERDSEIDDLAQEFIRPYDLAQAPLFRIEVTKIGTKRYVLLFDVHHIVADGSSVEIMVQDGCQLYFKEPEDLPELKIQYKDFASWQNDFLESEEIEDQREYWINRFKGEIPILNMPVDYPRPAIKSFEGDKIYFEINAQLTEKIKSFAAENGITLYMTLLSFYNVLLHKYTGQDDLVIGSPIAGRRHADVEGLVGMFVNNLAIKNYPVGDKTYKDFLEEIKENVLGAFENQDYQFDALVEELDLERDISRNPLFETEFDLQNMEFHEWDVDDLKFIPYELTNKTSQFDIALECQEEGNKINAIVEYCTKIFMRETIDRIARHYLALIEIVLENPEIKLANINLNNAEDKNLLLDKFNNTEREYSKEKLLSQLFEKQVEQSPDHTAVVFKDQSLTNKQLNERANQLAHRLRAKGVGRETKVGLLTDRSLDMIVGLLAVLKAGGTYIPLDPEYPVERINYMLNNSEVKLLLKQKELEVADDFTGDIINIDDELIYQGDSINLEPINEATDLAYIIYTSGSTGNPKGVMISHRAVHNFINGVVDKIDFSKNKKIISVTTYCFDIFVLESLLPLTKGVTTVIADKEEQIDPVKLNEAICKHNVDMIQTTPTRINALVKDEACKETFETLSCIMVGGENFPQSLLKELQDKTEAKIYNMYGPTETTVWSSIDELTDKDKITIGKPIANTSIYIVNKNNQLQPLGVYGELCIAGDGLARGYHKRDDLTEEVFIDNPFAEGEKMYKTGDLARWLSNGVLEVAGRIDHQVKIRGYRVEIGEIEHSLLSHQGINDVSIIKKEDKNNNNYLIAYFVVDDGFELPKTSQLINFLSERLPAYMIPSYFVEMEEMPLTPNGKIDRKALPEPNKAKADNEVTFVEPNSDIEKQIADIWKEELGREEVGVTDNFFEIGGHSLAVIQVTRRMRELADKEIPTLAIFQYPTIKSLVNLFKSQDMNFNKKIRTRTKTNNLSGDIAVIGMSGRFPGAKNIKEYWDIIQNGKEAITHFTDEELSESGINPELINNPNYVKAKGFLEDIEYFDSEFFGYSPKEADMMDPQFRLLHQSTWEVLEHAGYNPDEYDGPIGLFLGSASNMIWLTRFFGQDGNASQSYEAGTLNEKDFLATRISHKLNLQGPSFAVQTACSTSLVAIHLACQSLLKGECDIALAGGVAITLPRKEGYLYQEGMIFSPDGCCRPFDANANGTVFGNGIGIVALKRLEYALEDGDYIHAVVKGSAINNDGNRKVGFTAPSIEGQAEAIHDAYVIAGVDPKTVGYIETHGTGTQLGDPVEIQALQLAFNANRKQYCAIGSVKANIGHLDIAAGVAGFIKTVLSLQNKKLPPIINFESPNTKFNFVNSPFFINTKLRDWKNEESPLRAGVSSFGIGGTNCHIVLEEAPKKGEKS